jgi:hypothetical protein
MSARSRRSARLGGVAVLFAGLAVAVAPAAAAAAGPNPVTVENAQAGTTAWSLNGKTVDDATSQVKGYASATSVNLGGTISFSVTVNPAQTYSIDVYRLGYYQGLGGRLMLHVDPLSGTTQPACPMDAATGMIACAWQPGYSLTVPTNWTSGIYVAKLTNKTNYQSYIIFAVRDDARHSALLYQQSVTTYQAYNNYPNDAPAGSQVAATGKSLYDYNSSTTQTAAGTARAVKVSFDRPYAENDGAGDFFDYELNFVRWVEQMGYDIAYSTDVDTELNPGRLLDHSGFLSVGHDEYWSKGMYDAAVAARSAGVNLGFINGNSVYWQIRFESSADGTPARVITCYKSATLDPVTDATETVKWRDAQPNRPEQQLMGVMFTAQQPAGSTAAPYVVKNSGNWVYGGTGLSDGDSIPGIVGYEADRYVNGVTAPAAGAGSYVLLSSSPYTTSLNTTDYQQSSIYQAPSGAWVFATGTMAWSRGLYNNGSQTAADPRIQRITANVLDRFVAGTVALPAAPSNFAATPGDDTVALTWTGNAPDATGYVLERSTTPTFDVTTSVTVAATATSYTDSGLGSDVYYYRLRAVGSGGNSPYVNASASTASYTGLVTSRPALLANWRLGETSGTTAWDTEGAYNGTYTGGPTLGSAGAVARDSDPSATFTGSNRVTLPTVDQPVTDFTVEGWSYLTGTANTNYTVYGGNGSTVRILARPGAAVSSTAYAGVALNGTEYAVQPNTVESNLNAWVHWVLTRQGSTLTLYRNGKQVGQRTDLPAAATASLSGTIATQTGGAYPMTGRVDEIAGLTRPLSADEVSDDYVAAVNGTSPPAAAAAASYRDTVLSEPALLAYWRLGETVGTTAADSKGTYPGTYGTGVMLGSPGAVTNDPNPAASFNGTTAAKVTLPALPTVTDFTVEGWSYLTNATSNNNALYAGGNTVWLLPRPGTTSTATAAYASVWLNGTAYVLQPTSPATNVATWVHWVLTRQGSALRLYRNAVLIGQRTDLPATAPATVTGGIGIQGGTNYPLTGRIDEVAVYSGALSPTAVTAHYRSGLSGRPPA